MALEVQLRSQRRLRTVLQTASHVASGDFSDFLAAVSGDGVSFDTMPRGGPGASTLARKIQDGFLSHAYQAASVENLVF